MSNTPEWKKKLNFGEPTHSELTFEGAESPTKFFPVSVAMMFKLRRLAEPLARAISVLTNSKDQDNAHIHRKIGDGEEILSEAIDPKLAELRSEERANAIATLISAATEDENMSIIGEIIMDSIRLEDAPPPREFMNQIDLPQLGFFIKGVAIANKGVFGPLADRAEALFNQAQVEATQDNAQEDQTEQPTNGEISLTESS